jgi:hypothetical protein
MVVPHILARAVRQLDRLGHRLVEGRFGWYSHVYVWRISPDLDHDLAHPEALYGVPVVVDDSLAPDSLFLDRLP